MSDVLDGVMKEVLEGCKRKARREIKEELAKAKRDATSLRKQVTTLKRENKKLKGAVKTGPLKKREKEVAKREEQVRGASSKLIRIADELKSLRDVKLGVWMGDYNNKASYETRARQSRDLAALRKFGKGK
jgi:hypothetical protein